MARRTLEYRGYRGSIEVDTADFSLFGKILFIEEDYPYQGETFEDLEQKFQTAVDDHIKSCQDAGIDPPFSE